MISLRVQFNEKISFNKGSRLQGFLMENIDSEYADYLHTMQYHPYTQFLEINGDNTIWHINLLDDESEKHICPILDGLKSITLDCDEVIEIVDTKQYDLSQNELLSELTNTRPNRYAKIKILTPAAFKSYGEYYFWPDVKLIFNSIINRFNKFSVDFTLEDTNIINDIEENFAICDYNIRTKNFYLEGVKIKGFVGDIIFRFNGPQQLVNIGNMLLKYGEFTGIGIKTSIGMGGFNIAKESEE